MAIERLGSEQQTRAVEVVERERLPTRLTPQAIEITKENIQLCERLVTDVLEPDIDWGSIPGVPGNSLWDPGAAKIMGAFNCYPLRNILSKVEEADLISFTIETQLIERGSQRVIGSGIGACSTRETKYKYRWLTREETFELGYSEADLKGFKKRKDERRRVPNPEYGELVNTIAKMAAKRSEADAAQSLPGVLSALKKIFSLADVPNWRPFEARLPLLGLNHSSAKGLLGIKSFKADWIDKGRTLEEAYQLLKQMVQREGSATPQAEAMPSEPPIVTKAREETKAPKLDKSPDEITKEDIPDLNAVFRLAFHYWSLQPPEVLKELGYKSMIEVSEPPWECWLKLKAVYAPQ